MKKTILTLLLAIIVLGMGTVNVFASDNKQQGGTDLEIINESEWLLHIPANQTITAANTVIGAVYISGSIEPTQNVEVTVSNEGFFSRRNHSDVLNFDLLEDGKPVETILFLEEDVTRELKHSLMVGIDNDDFALTKAGSYHTNISFEAQLLNIGS